LKNLALIQFSDDNQQVVDYHPDFLNSPPLEVKLTQSPSKSDAKHLLTFLDEYKDAEKAYVVCQTPRIFKMHDNIYALPWQELPTIFE
jgi:hypothetical protein